MPRSSSPLLQYIRVMAGAYRNDPRSDAELLSIFAATRDERAFTSLMGRHGPLVWSVCSRVLGDTQDAEDAFQGTFLALSNKASKIHVKETLAGWLHQVARRTARHAQSSAKSRPRLREHLQPAARPEPEQDEAHEVLHDELAKLPENLRVPLVLHYLEGKTQLEIARILGVSEPAVWKRLMRGKWILHKRLTQRGLTLGAATLGALLEATASRAAVPAGLVGKTVKAAMDFRDGTLTDGIAELARQVLNQTPVSTPWWLKGWLIVVVCTGGLGAGAGLAAWRAGFFGTEAAGPPAVLKKEASHGSENNKHQSPRSDLYGDLLPPGALVRLGTTRFRHHDVGSLAFTPDGKSVMTAGPDNPPRLWDIATGAMLRKFGNLPASSVKSAALSPDGRFLACSNEENRGLYVWETATGKLVRAFPGTGHDMLSRCAFSPDSKMIAAQLNGRLGVWEVGTGRELWTQPQKGMLLLAFSADGERIASAPFSQVGVTVWDARNGRKVRELGPAWEVQDIAFSPTDGALLVSYKWDRRKGRSLYLWDVNTGKERWRLKEPAGEIGFLESPIFYPNGKIVATWGMIAPGHDGIHLWDAATGKKLRPPLDCPGGLKMAFSPNSQLLAGISHTGVLHFWDATSGKELHRQDFGAHKGLVSSAGFLADEETLVSGGDDGTIRLWDSRTGREKQILMKSTLQSSQLRQKIDTHPTVSPDGRILAAVFGEGKREMMKGVQGQFIVPARICLWDVASGKNLHCLSAEGFWVRKIAFSPDGKLLAAEVDVGALGPGVVFLWDVATGKRLAQRFTGSLPIFAPNGKSLIISGGVPAPWVAFIDLATGKEIHRIDVNSNGFNGAGAASVDISRDGRTLAVGRDKILLYSLFWNYPPLQVAVNDHPRQINTPPLELLEKVCLSPDARLVASTRRSAAAGSPVYVWEVATGKEYTRFLGHRGLISTLCFSPDGRRLVSGGGDTTLLVWDVTGCLQDDGALRSVRRSVTQLARLYDKLGDYDPGQSRAAVWELAAAGSSAVSVLEKRLRPKVANISPENIAQCIRNLDAKEFQVRKRARSELANLGELSEPALRQALLHKPSVEARCSLRALLSVLEENRITPSADTLRGLRAVEVLEQIDTAQARHVLKKLAAGAPGTLTDAAETSLGNLARRHKDQKERIDPAKEFQ